MTKDEALKLALEALVSAYQGKDKTNQVTDAITAIKEALAQPEQEPVQTTPSFTQLQQIIKNLEHCPSRDSKQEFLRVWIRDWTEHKLSQNTTPPTPPCPKDLFQFECAVEDVDLVCFLEYSPEEKGYRDSYGAPYEPDIEECMTLNNAYIAGTDVDIAHMILQSMVDHIEVSALEKFKDGDE